VKTKFLLLAFSLILGGSLLLSACASSASPTATQAPASTATKAAASPAAGTATSPTTAAASGFANPNLLVDTALLAQNLNDPKMIVIDVRPAKDYQAGHIKGAVNIPVETTYDANRPQGRVEPKEKIEDIFGSEGVTNDKRVILYDAGKETKAPRVFWTLEYYGHKNVAVLDGGFKKWTTEKRDTTAEGPNITPAKFTAKAEEGRYADKQLCLTGLGKPGVVFVDARSPKEYTGEDLRSKRGGHIPGAVNIDWTTLFTAGDVPVLKSPQELQKIYVDAGVTKDKEVHAY